MKTQLAIWAGKAAGVISRMIGNGGTTISGVVARKLDSQFLRHLRSSAKEIIYITGTNGKTTTANMLAHLLVTKGNTVIANREGSNMVTGISAAIVRNAPFIGFSMNDTAVIEVDEASLPKAVQECQPDYLIVTNFFRDQLDRYGEIDTLIRKMKDGLRSTNVKLILNADDPFVNRFSDLPNEKIYIGINANACRFQSHAMGESKYCPNCQRELSYSFLHFGHLGYYSCICGFARHEPNIEAQKVFETEKGIGLIVNGEDYRTTLKGKYNAYNILFAIGVCHDLGMKYTEILNGLACYQKENGRMQEFFIKQNIWRLNLVKNPAGANLTLSEFLRISEKKQLIFCLNDLLADGEDISWIWDIDMELANCDNVKMFITSGNRAHDAALRLKYAGISERKIIICPNMKKAVLEAKRNGLPVDIMATYTCLSPMVKILSKEEEKSGLSDFFNGEKRWTG